MIKFVYFDLGGVVIRDFDGTDNWDRLKKELGITKENNDKFEQIWNKYKEEINTTRDINSLIPILNNSLNLKISSDYSFLNGFVSRFTKNEIIWPVIESVKKSHKIGLLTNMYPRMFDAINKKGILPSIEFDVIIDSSKIGLQKPNGEIYKYAQEKARCKGNEILFIDNSMVNIDSVKDFGWNTFWYDNSDISKSTELLVFRLKNLPEQDLWLH